MLYVAIFFAALLLTLIIINKPVKKSKVYIEIKDAILSYDELIQHAKEIAKGHSISKNKRGISNIKPRLIDNYKYICDTYVKTNEKAKERKSLPSGSDWLLDNFYIVEETYKNVIRNINSDIYKELEVLDKGYYKNFPRIFILAIELISHTDGRIDRDILVNFLNSYQKIHPLSMNEIWALPLIISIALIEKLRFLCEKINATQYEWEKVESALRFDDYEKITEHLIKDLEEKKITSTYIEHLTESLKRNDYYYEPILDFIKSKLSDENISIDNAINIEHQEQSQHTISFGNSINSLRLIGSLDWNEIFEEVSAVDKILSNDAYFLKQDSETRDYYRHVVRKLSKRYKVSESKIAKTLILLSKEFGEDEKSSHIGYYLLDDGRNVLINKLTGKISSDKKKAKRLLYFSTIILFLLLSTSSFAYLVYFVSGKVTLSLVSFILILFPFSDISISIANWIFTHIFEATFLPKLEFKDGIPEEYKTIVIVPTVFPNVERVKSIFRQLEINYNANKGKNIYFAVLGDFVDSKEEIVGNEKEIIDKGLELVNSLNKKYSSDENIFYYFHRKKIFNQRQNKWMGWERKRGAIFEFVELIRGSQETTYTLISSDISVLKNAKYILTVDADTIMPIGSAEKLIGAISHPLNKAVFDESTKVVKKGYGLIQPRIGINIESANKSTFSRIFAGNGGIDPYSKAISDIYQDVFQEAIFTGKGIFDIDIFKESLKDIPENTLLSHDLIEGSYLRVGLVTDVELIDNYPEKYSSYMMRLHRWTRGDWQTIHWLKSKIRDANGRVVKNPLNFISKWKIIDNLRRSILPISYFILILFNILFVSNIIIFLIVISSMFFPIVLGLLDYINLKWIISPREKLNGNLIYGLKATVYQSLLNFAFLPYQAYMMAHAIFKTLYRIYISNKNTLEWVTAADVESTLKNDLKSYFIRMYPGIILSVICLVSSFAINSLIFSTLIVCILWLSSPYIAYSISIIKTQSFEIEKEDVEIIRRIARKTWLYYEEFSGKDNNYLPVDNYQQSPVRKVAHRTSPTNIGFYLLSCLSAYNLGYLSFESFLNKIYDTLTTLEKLKKWNGHLFNWYDTRTLEVLRPYYISTVDNGNFIGYLITLRQGINDLLSKPLLSKETVLGLRDTINLTVELDNNFNDRISELLSYEKLDYDLLYKLCVELSSIPQSKIVWTKKTIDYAAEIKNQIETLMPFILLNTDDEKLSEQITNIKENPSLNNLLSVCEKVLNEKLSNEVNVFEKAYNKVSELINLTCDIINRLNKIIDNTDFTLLYDEKRDLFSIGFNVEENKLTNSYYDLLASESRLASYLAVARREVPSTHWFKLGRSLVKINGYRSLVSWTGTMFEYFMPPIIMKTFDNTLLSETYHTAIKAQINYGESRKVPWGTSESGFYTFDLLLNYQYKAFGVPDLGLKRGLINDMVVSPYSTILALPFSPKESMKNIKKILNDIGEGVYGLYEAIDYTPDRLPRNKNAAVVESFMAHHQGMILASINNFLNKNILVEYFHSDPVIKCGEFLLQEKVPLRVIITKEHKETVKPFKREEYKEQIVVRELGAFDCDIPVCHVLSNGNYTLMLTNGGSCFSKLNDIYINRWRDDVTQRLYGNFIFIRNLNSDKIFSTTFEPVCKKTRYYKVKYSPDKAEYLTKEDDLEVHTEICVSPEDNCEIRKVTITNFSNDDVLLETTSYFEIVLNNIMADIAHPTFSNLFVRTEFDDKYNAIFASRRPREEGRTPYWAFSSVVLQGNQIGDTEYETDRLKFIGRGKSLKDAIALKHPLSKSVGAVLDPIMSLRNRLEIKKGESATITYVIGVGPNKDEVYDLCKKYTDTSNIQRAFELAGIRSKMEFRFLNLKPDEVEAFDSMLSHIIYLSPLKQRYKDLLKNNTKGQQSLWQYGISGDLPVVLVTIDKSEDIDQVRTMLKAHEYWRNKGIRVDLVILNQDEGSYLQPLRDLILDTVMRSITSDKVNSAGGVFILNANEMPVEDVNLLYTVARLIIHSQKGSIVKQIKSTPVYTESYKIEPTIISDTLPYNDIPLGNLEFFNEIGGFDTQNNEYVIKIKGDTNTPLPWSNVIANEKFGSLITEAGGGYSWYKNSRENKITPWSNDPVSDSQGEVIYIKDNETNEYWSITPNPVRQNKSYIIRHGLGYSKFIQENHYLYQELISFVPVEDTLKINLIKIKNTANVDRKISLYYYIRPVLGVSENSSQQFILTDVLPLTGTIIFKNTYNTDFPGTVSFVDTSEIKDSFTCDRMEFIGPYKDLRMPYGIMKDELSNNFGAGYDPCVAIKISVDVKSQEEKEIVFLLGAADKYEDVTLLVNKYKSITKCVEELNKVKTHWNSLVNVLQVKTPDRSMDIMLNSWLIYQTLSCRLLARSAFYQSGGAYGFRDQLQDVLSLINISPKIAREQIILHSKHQFVEGDVLHWWHNTANTKGIRTKFSDDLLWLPFVVIEYIYKTGDYSILDVKTKFLEGEPLRENEDEKYGVPVKSEEKASIYEHCIRAIERSLNYGEHGIPLMGSGDWNDGMNTVGNKGKGESVWLGWFIFAILKKFIPLCKLKYDYHRAERYEDAINNILKSIEENAWDGEWYRRAYFDDGTPLGSSLNTECKIDSLAQTWGLISGAADYNRALIAMKSLENYLINREAGIIMLFTPPFDKSDLHPGYIKGYVPGVRENGGQYTHAATWVIYAYAILGDGDKAWELFNMINPINHSRTHFEVAKYKVEPYVMAADVYAVEPHVGRGGWTWYTGSSSWMYKVGIEEILGFKKSGDKLMIDPCIPKHWQEYEMTYRYMDTTYKIRVFNTDGKNKGVSKTILDGNLLEKNIIPLVNDVVEHVVEVVL
ncbi:N,N'-diacetylchitobiose phosphorylase [Caloramator mitchellensis]|uniref:N,N'-diacetylchitobiose phosphorylase n=1 Tax=Caloramator mitchellensis TaxID=908809 RepID=A0A0R3JWE5_CALMK|nr:glucoamylase family protein [Caloramator mitchellensis]KRQ87879.1 N,N'-diacetylchitobiose phosphorylase [Caloramator mitchellensis]